MNAKKNIKLFLEKGYVTKYDRLLSLIMPFYKSRIANHLFSKIGTEISPTTASFPPLIAAMYTGNNSVVKRIQQQLQEATLPAIKAALVHGSIGDENEIGYSDFDGILILDPREIKKCESNP
ncbi:MAG: hypothetical protein IPO63_05660 [Bacteroidetes bacterium]|nr:hypothetical protein [Bacteroidota bacterium]